MKTKYCAPGHDQGFTCFSLEQLQDFSQKLSQNDNMARQTLGSNWKNLSHKELYDKIAKIVKERYGDLPETEWLKLPFVRAGADQELVHETFRPSMPHDWKDDPKTWLTTDDIAKVMHQYSQKYPDFIFFGPVASDCPEEYPCELSGFSCEKMLKSGIKKIGIIFNLDKHNQSGSHWVAVWISIPEKVIEYYDSYAVKPPRLIMAFMKRVKDQAEKNGMPMEIISNDIRHQYGGSECGVFSMYYIIQRLHGKSREETLTQKPTDTLMNQLRLYFYRPQSDLIGSAQKVVDEIPIKDFPNRPQLPSHIKIGGAKPAKPVKPKPAKPKTTKPKSAKPKPTKPKTAKPKTAKSL